MMKAQAKKKQGKSSRLHKWVLACVLVLVIIGLPILLVMPGSTKPIREVADRFQPPNDWILSFERITPPKLVCIDGNPCPEIRRDWQSPSTTPLSTIEKLLDNAGWTYKAEEGCRQIDEYDLSKANDGKNICSIDITMASNDYRGSMYFASKDEQLEVKLFLW